MTRPTGPLRPGPTRRTFLRTALFAGGAVATVAGLGGLAPVVRLAQAQNVVDDPRYFIFCYFAGGWDILLGLDPRDPRVFTEGNLRTTRIQPGYGLITGNRDIVTAPNGMQFGPFIGELAGHAERLAVVRGMSMDTLTHEVGRRRFLTGKPPSGLTARGSSAATMLAARFGEADAIPNMAVQNESYNADQPFFASALSVNSVADLLRALRPSAPILPSLEERQIHAFQREVAACPSPSASETFTAAEAARLKARDMVQRGLDRLFDFTANTPEMQALRQHYGVTGNDSSPEAQALLAAQAICGGVSRCVTIQATSGLDTHFQEWATDQGPRQQRGFNAVARLISDLARREHPFTGRSYLDHTVVVGFSEFSRTALLNPFGGRDHALTNACFLAGGGIVGGQVIGASSDVGLAPQNVDFATGRVADVPEAGETLRPEAVLRTLFSLSGVHDDVADLRVEPIGALLPG
jgi:uncharacterized protein (DUF1501 family)